MLCWIGTDIIFLVNSAFKFSISSGLIYDPFWFIWFVLPGTFLIGAGVSIDAVL